MQVLVAIDASEASGKMVEYLRQHAALFANAQMTCVYIDPPSPLRAVGVLGADPGMPAVRPAIRSA